jgi:hypothetical protein
MCIFRKLFFQSCWDFCCLLFSQVDYNNKIWMFLKQTITIKDMDVSETDYNNKRYGCF